MKPFLFLLAVCLSFPIFSQSEKEKVESTITKEIIEGHIYFLSDDLLEGRDTGTPGNKIAASYLANTLRSYGVKPSPKTGNYYQKVPLEKVSPAPITLLSVNGKALTNVINIEAHAIDYNGDAVFVGYGMPEDYSGKNVKGKIVLVQSGSKDAKDSQAAFRLTGSKKEAALANGAVGVVELADVTGQMWGFLNQNFNSSKLGLTKKEEEDLMGVKIPYVWLQDAGGALVNQIKDTKKNEVRLASQAPQKEIIMSQNVVGIVEGTDPVLKNEYIIYSAHYDHIGMGTPDETGDAIYNGARDNGVGVTTVLSMAQNLAKYPTKRSALFILFTAEEKGLLGSKFYVENPIVPLRQMVYCFNSDNGGYNDTTIATIIGLERTTASQHIKDAATTFGLIAKDDPAPEQGLFDRSDNVHFARKGIPAPTFSLGFNAFDAEIMKYYHRPGDEADSLDYDYLLKFFRSYVLSGRNIGNASETPFWVKGDTYEESGKKLYGM